MTAHPQPDRGWHDDDERNVRYYSDLVARHGLDVKSLDWGSRASQQLRFRVLAKVAPLGGMRILDVGCGLADLHAWFREHGMAVDYTGLDITPAMIAAARERFPNDRFVDGDLLQMDAAQLGEFDFVLSSGIFTHRQARPQEFLEAMVARMFAVAKKGVAFNSLSAWAADSAAGEFYADPLATLRFCRTLTPWTTLRHDYHARDFTVYLYRDRNA